MAKKFLRYFEFDRAKIDAEKRTAPMVFSSETPVDRGSYDEILDHGACDLGRMQDGAAFLLNHNPDQQIGVVETASIDGKEGRAIVRFGKSPLAEEIFQDVKDGIRKHVSVGYERTKAINRTKLEGGRDAIRFAWAPFELSSVPIPADPNTGIGRNKPDPEDPFSDPMKRSALLFDKAITEQGGGTPDTNASRAEIIKDFRAEELKRLDGIDTAADALAKQFPEAKDKFREMASKAARSGTSTADFNAELLKAIPGIRQVQTDVANLGLSDKEQKRYSMMRAIQCMLTNKPIDGLELECSREVEKRSGMRAQGFWVPTDVAVDPGSSQRGRMIATGTRDLNVTTASQGGNFVATQLVTPIIEILRNRMVTRRLGVQMLSGLSGNIAIPRQTGAATAYSLAEAAVLTKSTQAINQISMTPKRVGAWNAYTKQLLLQGSPDVENFVRDDLMNVLAIKLDYLTLQGTGSSSQPTGILNTSGIGSVTFGAAATWAKVLAFETALAVANADAGNMAYVTTPAVRGKWKAAAKIGSTFPIFLWEKGAWGDGSNDGEVNGYRAACTNQIDSDYVAFGNWIEAILGMWGGYDVVVDPYTSATSATVNVTVNTFVDVAVRHAASFAWSTDSGAQ